MAAAHRALIQELLEKAIFGPERMIADRQNPLENLPAGKVFRRYRFLPETIMNLVLLFGGTLAFTTQRNMPLPPVLQVCCFLRFLATGSFQIVIGDTLSISQATVSRLCRRLGRILADRLGDWVTFPDDNEKTTVKSRFQRIAGFPNGIGCVDGCQIRLRKPSRHEAEYVNRKGFHSLNVQMTCDADFKITNLVARWPGSTHDARIWRESSLRQEFENGRHNGFLLADSGYACRGYMLTPFLRPTTPGQERYNISLCKTRVIIEQTLGILKKRFAILHFGIRSSPSVAVRYISSFVILHNFGIIHGDIVEHDIDISDNNEVENIVVDNVNDTGNHVRQEIVNSFFT